MRGLLKLPSVLALMFLVGSSRASDGTKLLDTTSLANEVKRLSILLSESPPGTTVEKRRLEALQMQKQVTGFIVDQLRAMPAISQEELRRQLQAILCSPFPNTQLGCGCDQPPYVFDNSWGGSRGTSQFVVAYVLDLGFMSSQGSMAVIESYMRDNSSGVLRRTAIGGGEFDGYIPNFQMVGQFYGPPEIWVLAWGQVLGASGRGLHGKATLYRVKVESVEEAWSYSADNVTAERNPVGWEVNYADHRSLYANDTRPYFLDVYAIDYAQRSFSRVIHYRHSGE